MLADGAALLEASHMYRSSLTLAFVVLYSAAGAASDLSSVYVAPGGIYAPSAAAMCVRDRPIGNRLTPNPVTDISSPLTRRRARHIVHRHQSMASTERATPRSRSMSNAHRLIPSVTTEERLRAIITTVRSATTQGNATMRWNMHRGRLCPCLIVGGRDATTAMAGWSPAINSRLARIRYDCDDSA